MIPEIKNAVVTAITQGDVDFLRLMWQKSIYESIGYCALQRQYFSKIDEKMLCDLRARFYDRESGVIVSAIENFKLKYPSVEILLDRYVGILIGELHACFKEAADGIKNYIEEKMEGVSSFYLSISDEMLSFFPFENRTYTEEKLRYENQLIASSVLLQRYYALLKDDLEKSIVFIDSKCRNAYDGLNSLTLYSDDNSALADTALEKAIHACANIATQLAVTYENSYEQVKEQRRQAVEAWLSQFTEEAQNETDSYRILFESGRELRAQKLLSEIVESPSDSMQLLGDDQDAEALRAAQRENINSDSIQELIRATLVSFYFWHDAVLNDYQQTVYHIAAQVGVTEILDVFAATELTPGLEEILINAEQEIVKPELRTVFLSAQDQDGNTPFHVAMHHDQYEFAIKLLDCSADLTLQNNASVPAYAARNSFDQAFVFYAASLQNLDWLTRLKQTCPIAINALDNHNKNALHITLKNGDIHTALHLIELGIDLFQPNNAGILAFEQCSQENSDPLAIQAARSNCLSRLLTSIDSKELKQALLLEQKDTEGNVAIHHAWKSGNVTMILDIMAEDVTADIQNNAQESPVTHFNEHGDTLWMQLCKAGEVDALLKFLLSNKYLANNPGNNVTDNTVLHQAIIQHDANMTFALLEAEDLQFDLDKCNREGNSIYTVTDVNGNNFLHFMAQNNRYELLLALVMRDYLLPLDIVNAQNIDGDTPLHCAMQAGHHSLAFALVRLGANLHLQNNAGVAAYQQFDPAGLPLPHAMVYQKERDILLKLVRAGVINVDHQTAAGMPFWEYLNSLISEEVSEQNAAIKSKQDAAVKPGQSYQEYKDFLAITLVNSLYIQLRENISGNEQARIEGATRPLAYLSQDQQRQFSRYEQDTVQLLVSLEASLYPQYDLETGERSVPLQLRLSFRERLLHVFLSKSRCERYQMRQRMAIAEILNRLKVEVGNCFLIQNDQGLRNTSNAEANQQLLPLAAGRELQRLSQSAFIIDGYGHKTSYEYLRAQNQIINSQLDQARQSEAQALQREAQERQEKEQARQGEAQALQREVQERQEKEQARQREVQERQEKEQARQREAQAQKQVTIMSQLTKIDLDYIVDCEEALDFSLTQAVSFYLDAELAADNSLEEVDGDFATQLAQLQAELSRPIVVLVLVEPEAGAGHLALLNPEVMSQLSRYPGKPIFVFYDQQQGLCHGIRLRRRTTADDVIENILQEVVRAQPAQAVSITSTGAGIFQPAVARDSDTQDQDAAAREDARNLHGTNI